MLEALLLVGSTISSDFLQTLRDWVQGMIGILIDAITNLSELFYTDTGITIFGILAIMGLGIGLTRFVLNFVLQLFYR